MGVSWKLKIFILLAEMISHSNLKVLTESHHNYMFTSNERLLHW